MKKASELSVLCGVETFLVIRDQQKAVTLFSSNQLDGDKRSLDLDLSFGFTKLSSNDVSLPKEYPKCDYFQ